MTISTYAELKTAVANWTGRSDLTSRDDEFIDNVEAKLSRRLRIRSQETTATGSFVSGTATISPPADFREIRTLTYELADDVPQKIEFLTLEQAEALEYSADAPPAYYTFAGGAIRLYPTPDSAYAYTIRYLTGIPALSGSAPTNYYLTNFPDLYLYGCCVEACAFIGDHPNLPLWKAGFEECMKEVEKSDSRERFQSPTVTFDADLLRASYHRITTDS